MFGFVGKLFGTDKAIDSIIDKDNGLLVRAGTALGNLHYSDQEKANDEGKTREWGIRQLEALAPFKVVQRILAFATAALWIFVGLNVVAAIWVEAVWGLKVKQDMMAFAMSDYVFWPVMAIFSLYFLGGVWKPGGGGK